MSIEIPDANQRWRCAGCGNLTRFDVTRTRRTTEFWHFDLAGDHRVEETDVARRGGRDRELPLVRARRRDRARARAPTSSPTTRPPAETSHAVSEVNAVVQLAELPDEVRLRVLSLTADVLGQVPTLPAPLRKVADFAPGPPRPPRRARRSAPPSTGDDDFRERVAVQVEARLPAPLADLTAVPPDADPVEVGALSWLIRPEGWESVLDGRARTARRADRGRAGRVRRCGQVAGQGAGGRAGAA